MAKKPRERTSNRSPATSLDRRFEQLLDTLGLEIPKGSHRPVARDQRLSEEIMEAFLNVSGEQLVELLRGREGAPARQEIPLHQLEAVVSLFYGTINESYIGVDSHKPSRFLQVHPFLLENLAESDAARSGGTPSQDHPQCHGPLCVRIVPHSVRTLQEDLEANVGAHRYFQLHKKHNVILLSVNPLDYSEIYDELLPGEWTGDIGLWLNTCALLFEASIKPGNKELRLELLYPHEQRFGTYQGYIGELLKQAERVDLVNNNEVRSQELDQDTLNHLQWSLDSMFQPNLADVWDEFVSPQKRVTRLGPFVEKQIEAAKIERASILDAAMGVGCDSVYLVSRGYDVISNEIDPRLIAHAVELNQLNGNHPLDIRRFDWRHFEHLANADTFDVVLALGNSMSCLYSESDVRSVLTRFAHLLKPGGLLIVDERDYPSMFEEEDQMKSKDFLFPGEVVYCSNSIRARPRRLPKEAGVDRELLTLEYIRLKTGKPVGTFEVLPFAEGQLMRLLEESGFRNVKQYYNLKTRRGKAPIQFVTYVASRGYDNSEWARGGKYREAVVAFTDITDSSGAKRRLGENQYAKEWEAHQRQVGKLTGQHNGEVINDTGDGFLLSFTSPSAAVDCLSALVKAPGSSHLSVRAGVNKGKARTDADGKLRGKEVDIASRICDSDPARPNRIVVDDRVKIKLNSRPWRKEREVELRGVDRRDLWVLDG